MYATRMNKQVKITIRDFVSIFCPIKIRCDTLKRTKEPTVKSSL